jgi:hypothetical protein
VKEPLLGAEALDYTTLHCIYFPSWSGIDLGIWGFGVLNLLRSYYGLIDLL